MGIVITIKKKKLFKRVLHKLFNCPSFWSIKPAFSCPNCGRKYRCYWDGNDIEGHGTNLCNKCAKKIENDN